MPRHLTRDTIPAATLERLEKAFGDAVSAAEAAQAAGATIDPIQSTFVTQPELLSNTSFIMDAAIVKTLEVELGDALTAWVNGKEATHEPLNLWAHRHREQPQQAPSSRGSSPTPPSRARCRC